jgi:hypothetical protein
VTATSPPGSRGLSDGAEWVCPVGISSASYKPRQSINPIHVLMDWPPLAGETAGSAFRKDLFVPVRGQRLPPPLPCPAGEVRIRDAEGTRSWNGNLLRNRGQPAHQGRRGRLDHAADAGCLPPHYLRADGSHGHTGTVSTNEYRIAVQGASPSPPGAVGSHPPTHRPVVQTLSDVLLDL